MAGFERVHYGLLDISARTELLAGISDHLEDRGGYLVPPAIREGHNHITLAQLPQFYNHLHTLCSLPTDAIFPHLTMSSKIVELWVRGILGEREDISQSEDEDMEEARR